MKKIVSVILAGILICLSSCIYFQTINQPSVSLPNEIFTVSISVTTEGGEYEPYFGVCLPVGWTIPGDSIQCSGEYSAVIYHNDSLSIEQENLSPSQAGYYWWVGNGMVDTLAIGSVYADLFIQTDNQTGIFSIDYMLGDSYNGINHQRSNDYQIEIADEYFPYALQATVVGDSVILNWAEPFNTNGLLGYYIYRDEQQINYLLVTDTTFIDENPLEGIHNYSVSSYYNNGNTYLIPYEVRVMYGNSLYVSQNGSNSNSGSSFNEALLTISYALFFLTPDSLNPKTIYLSRGIFSPSTTGELFPLEWKNYISLIGITDEETVLDGDSSSGIIKFIEITDSRMMNMKLQNGYADYGGGIYCHRSNIELMNMKIMNNTADGGGGGIYIGPSSNAKLVNVIIEDNLAGGGGGLYMSRAEVTLINVILSYNKASYSSGFSTGGAISVSSESYLILKNVTIAKNSASLPAFGGGIYLSHSSDSYLENSILWNNIPQQIDLGRNSITGNNTISIAFSDIQGGLDSIFTYNVNTVNWLEGNINNDPLFAGTGNYPYTLSGGSPCIDTGNPDTVNNDPEDPNNSGYAHWPAMGVLRNDMGAYGGPNAASWNIVTNIEDDENKELQIPTEYELSQNYPNPFNPSTTIQYSIKERSSVELILYDILGSQVEVLLNEEQDAGYYKVNFNAGRLASGIYFYRLQAGSFVETKKMMLLK